MTLMRCLRHSPACLENGGLCLGQWILLLVSICSSNRSSACRVGTICPTMNRECAAVITKTGHSAVEPSSSGICLAGNHRSRCAASPG